MSHFSTRPLEADEQESLDSLLNLDISELNEAIQKTSATTFENKQFVLPSEVFTKCQTIAFAVVL